MSEKITAIIPIKKNSVRLKNKNFLPFYKNKSLLELKILQLKKIKHINEIVVSSDSEKAKKIAKKYNVSFHEREKFFASSKCSGSDFFNNLAVSIKSDYLVYCPCTSPIIKMETYNTLFKEFYEKKNFFDSFNTVKKIKSFLWKGSKSINYDVKKAPNSQDLPDNYYAITFGVNIISRKKMIKMRNIVGEKPKFVIVSKLESTDIDDVVDFDSAKALFKKNYKKLL